MHTAESISQAIADTGFVHVSTFKQGGGGRIVKLMRTRDGLAVKQPSGEFREFAADAWSEVAEHINTVLGLKPEFYFVPVTPAPSIRRAPRSAGRTPTVKTPRAARAKLREYEETICWRGQYANGDDRPAFGLMHHTNKGATRTLCGRTVPKHLLNYEDYGDPCQQCERAFKRLERIAEEGGY